MKEILRLLPLVTALFWLAFNARADQSASYRQEIIDLLSGDKRLSYGSVTVVPDGNAFLVTIGGFVQDLSRDTRIDWGDLRFRMSPESDDLRRFSYPPVTLEVAMTPRGSVGRPIMLLTLSLDRLSGSWSKKSGLCLEYDLAASEIRGMPADGSPGFALSDVTYTYGGIDHEGLIDGELRLAVKSFAYGAGTSMLSVSDVNFVWAERNVSWRDYVALWQEAVHLFDSEDAGRRYQVYGRMLALAPSWRSELSAGGITVGSPLSPAFSVSNPRIRLEQRGRDTGGIEAVIGFHYSKLAMASLRSDLSGLEMKVLPTGFDLEMTMKHLPADIFFDSLLGKLAGANVDKEGLIQQAVEFAAADFVRALSKQPLDISISEGRFTAPGLSGNFTGEFTVTRKGFSGSMNLDLMGLEALIAEGPSRTCAV
jgi:hypothetical protein